LYGSSDLAFAIFAVFLLAFAVESFAKILTAKAAKVAQSSQSETPPQSFHLLPSAILDKMCGRSGPGGSEYFPGAAASA
jgi:hypothetical protein